MEEKKEIGFFEEELELMKKNVLENILKDKTVKSVDENIVKNIVELSFENIRKIYKSGKKENGALNYLKELYEKKYISEKLYNKFLEYEEFRRIKQKKKFNTVRMVDFILKTQFKINFENYPNGLPLKIEKHIEMCIDYTIGKNYQGVRKEYIKEDDLLIELRKIKSEETKFINIKPKW